MNLYLILLRNESNKMSLRSSIAPGKQKSNHQKVNTCHNFYSSVVFTSFTKTFENFEFSIQERLILHIQSQ